MVSEAEYLAQINRLQNELVSTKSALSYYRGEAESRINLVEEARQIVEATRQQIMALANAFEPVAVTELRRSKPSEVVGWNGDQWYQWFLIQHCKTQAEHARLLRYPPDTEKLQQENSQLRGQVTMLEREKAQLVAERDAAMQQAQDAQTRLQATLVETAQVQQQLHETCTALDVLKAQSMVASSAPSVPFPTAPSPAAPPVVSQVASAPVSAAAPLPPGHVSPPVTIPGMSSPVVVITLPSQTELERVFGRYWIKDQYFEEVNRVLRVIARGEEGRRRQLLELAGSVYSGGRVSGLFPALVTHGLITETEGRIGAGQAGLLVSLTEKGKQLAALLGQPAVPNRGMDALISRHRGAGQAMLALRTRDVLLNWEYQEVDLWPASFPTETGRCYPDIVAVASNSSIHYIECEVKPVQGSPKAYEKNHGDRLSKWAIFVRANEGNLFVMLTRLEREDSMKAEIAMWQRFMRTGLTLFTSNVENPGDWWHEEQMPTAASVAKK